MFHHDNVIKAFEEIVSNVSGFERDGYFQINGETTDISLSQIQLNDNFFSFDYFNQSILHFTNLNSALSILNSQTLRATNLSSIYDDKEELLHCLKLIGQYSDELEEQKKYTFVSCFTPFDRNEKIESFEYHWTEYGNKHRGVSFEFEIVRTPLYPDHYSLNVNYLDTIDETNRLLNALKDKRTNSVILKALIPLFASIKQPKYRFEKEVRLIAQYDKSSLERFYEDETFDFTLTKENEAQFYYKIPFYCPNENAEDKLLKLKKVYIGRRAEVNDGQLVILRRLTKILEQKNIEYKWLDD
jgi:hypothetical protein